MNNVLAAALAAVTIWFRATLAVAPTGQVAVPGLGVTDSQNVRDAARAFYQAVARDGLTYDIGIDRAARELHPEFDTLTGYDRMATEHAARSLIRRIADVAVPPTAGTPERSAA